MNRQQAEDNLSSTSLLDIIGDGLPPIRNKPNKRNVLAGHNLQQVIQSNELFFGDQILSLVEQMITEQSGVMTNASIEQGTIGDVNAKEWTTHCLKAKQSYLKDLKKLQNNYANTLEDITQKFVGKSQTMDVDSQIKSYVGSEFQKIDAVLARISEAIKKMSPSPSKNILPEKTMIPNFDRRVDDSILREQPIQNFDASTIQKFSQQTEMGQTIETDVNYKQYYDDVLVKMEKKYDEIYSLVHQSLLGGKGRDTADGSPMNSSRFSPTV